jgi:hypothetical protein
MDENADSTLDIEDFPIACPECGSQMRLFGVEWESKRRDIYTFVCDLCGHTVARGVLTQGKSSGRHRKAWLKNQESECAGSYTGSRGNVSNADDLVPYHQ